jgi:tRNA (cytidine/uridine-2'-O-)-methyltransferase
MKRAGLDYWESVDWKRHENFAELEAEVGCDRIICIETPARQLYTQSPISSGSCLVFGNESRGLPDTIRDRYMSRIYGIPMLTENVRSLNLSNSVAIVLYDALRRLQSW